MGYIAIMDDKKMFSNRISQDLIKKIKHLSVDSGKPLAQLLEEALEDLLKKYQKITKR